mmetsp:Transcript_16102/g.36225  ORF Transcript_16102/g.36225 Transcript_16102/m.36225 type:complete len:205 (+) Transcript_16102:2176-2790(+)
MPIPQLRPERTLSPVRRAETERSHPGPTQLGSPRGKEGGGRVHLLDTIGRRTGGREHAAHPQGVAGGRALSPDGHGGRCQQRREEGKRKGEAQSQTEGTGRGGAQARRCGAASFLRGRADPGGDLFQVFGIPRTGENHPGLREGCHAGLALCSHSLRGRGGGAGRYRRGGERSQARRMVGISLQSQGSWTGDGITRSTGQNYAK